MQLAIRAAQRLANWNERTATAVADALESSEAATLGRSLGGTAASRTIDVLSQYGRSPNLPDLAGAAPGGLGLDDIGGLKSRPFRGFKGAGKPMAIALTVNEVVNTYQNPLLNLEQQNQRAGIQVATLGLKIGAARLVQLGVGALVASTGVGAPLAFGISVVGTGVLSGGFDIAKEELLRRLGL